MANKAISELPQAQNVNNQDLFVLEQSGIAKKLTAETFITEQGIIDALAEALDGHGGIQSVTLSSVSGRIRTYRITFTDQSATTFQVYDGTSIDRISRTSSSGLDDVYTIFLSDGTTTFFTVHNGADGTVSEAMLNDALKDKAPAITETTESSAIANFPDGADDMPLHNILAEINPVQDLTYGDPYPAGSGVNKFDESVFSNYGGVLQTSGVWHFNSLVNVLNKVLWTVPESIGQLTVTMWRKQSGVGSQGLRLVINYTDGTSVKVGNQNATGGTDVYSVTTDASKTVRDIAGDYGSNQNGTDVNVVVSIGSTAPSAYSPYSNICPITGWTGCNVTRTGKNLWKFGSSFTSSGAGSSFFPVESRPFFLPAGTYTWSFKANVAMDTIQMNFRATEDAASNITITFYVGTGTGTGIKSYTFTLAEDVRFVRNMYANTAIDIEDFQIEAGSSRTAYEAYSGTSLTVSWQTEAGTVYGGTIDVATGLLTVDRAMVTMTGADVRLADRENALWRIYTDALNDRFVGANVPYSISNKYSYVQAYTSINQTNNSYGFSANIGQMFIHDDTFTSADDIKASLNSSPLEIVYTLATPQTYQLTPQEVIKTLLGTNNVWADTGNVSVTYPADTKMYIEKLTMPTEDDLVANQAITSGKYFMIGNSLYLALANIASGAQITIGTNAQRVSLADALNTINS